RVQSLIGLARALSMQGQNEQAIRSFQKAISMDPEPQLYYLLGLEELKAGRLDDAVRNLEEATRLKPAFADAQIQLASVLAAKGLTGEAIEHYRAAVAADAKSVAAVNT